MKKLKRLVRKILWILLICIACVGVGVSGGVPIPFSNKRKDQTVDEIELIDEERETGSEEEAQLN